VHARVYWLHAPTISASTGRQLGTIMDSLWQSLPKNLWAGVRQTLDGDSPSWAACSLVCKSWRVELALHIWQPSHGAWARRPANWAARLHQAWRAWT